jgi:NhaC family Na+:H+ antiporter
LSDTTNLAPAVTGTNVFDHIKNMMPTTIPAMLIAVVIYTIMGFSLLGGEQDVSFDRIDAITTAIDQQFNLSPWLLLPAALVIFLALTKRPPIPTLFVGVLAGGVTAYFAQGVGLHDFFTYANYGFTMDSGVEQIDSLLTRGGIQSMMWTISLILIALAFGGTLERTGCLQSIIRSIMKRISTFSGLQTSAICTAMATNVVAGDPYLSIALPGRMYSPVYRGMGYSTLNLARGCEEGGTLLSPLIPWNAGGAFVIGTLGLLANGETINLLYIPFAFACWLSPVFGILYAFTGWFSPKASDAEREKWKSSNESILTLEELRAGDADEATETHV